MILKPRQIEAALSKPDPAWRAILVYGPDSGLVRERCRALLDSALGETERDPFRYSELDASTITADPARLADEAEAVSPLGRRAVLIRANGDGRAAESLAAPLKAFLAAGPKRADAEIGRETLMVIEGGDLAKRSKLRAACEGPANAAALPCYRDEGQALRTIIQKGLAAHKVTASAEAAAYLEQLLGGDRLATRGEIEKLALYAGPGGAVDLKTARRVAGGNAAVGLDDLCQAVAGGACRQTETILARLADDGVPEIVWLRSAAKYFLRLHKTAGRVAAGQAPEQAIAALRPPLFFKAKPAFLAALRGWSPARLAAALERLLESERQCKRSGAPAAVLAHRALLSVAAAGPRRSGS